MLRPRIGIRSLHRAFPVSRRTIPIHRRYASHVSSKDHEEDYVYPHLSDAEDPNMNGGYVNPPRVKRQFRDPHVDWWDKQERRKFGEPVHEDDAELSMFSLHEYTFVKPSTAIFQLGCFVAAVLSLCGIVSLTYPDRPSAPREFEGGLERELGGPGAVRARAPGDP